MACCEGLLSLIFINIVIHTFLFGFYILIKKIVRKYYKLEYKNNNIWPLISIKEIWIIDT